MLLKAAFRILKHLGALSTIFISRLFALGGIIVLTA